MPNSDDELSTSMGDLSMASEPSPQQQQQQHHQQQPRSSSAMSGSSVGSIAGGRGQGGLKKAARQQQQQGRGGGGGGGQQHAQHPSPSSPKSVRTTPGSSPNAKGGRGGGGGGGGRGGGGFGKGNQQGGPSRGGSGSSASTGGSGGADGLNASGSGKRAGQTRGSRAESEDWGRLQLAHSKMVHLFSHLPQYSKRSHLSRTVSLTKPELHPAVVSLGLLYADGSIRGSNARTAAMLLAFKEVVLSYQLPEGKVLSLDLDKALKPHIHHLTNCRPHSIAMGNAIKWLRNQIHGIKNDVQLAQAKEEIVESIDTYVTERITFAAQMLARCAIEKISDGDVIMVYGRSYSVELTLQTAKKEGKSFSVVVVDSRPLLEGRRLLATLSKSGIPTTYVNLNASSYIMRTVSKVLLGAAAMLSNGAVISRSGTAVMAMMARRFNIPAIFCCETYKFSDKVQLDSICWNEIGDPSELLSPSPGTAPSSTHTHTHTNNDTNTNTNTPTEALPPLLKLLNIRYDLTPMKYVSLVITEVGMIPPTSVPVLIREYNKDDVNLTFEF